MITDRSLNSNQQLACPDLLNKLLRENSIMSVLNVVLTIVKIKDSGFQNVFHGNLRGPGLGSEVLQTLFFS